MTSLGEVGIVAVGYLVITFLCLVRRALNDHSRLGWIAGESYWHFFWPKFRLWGMGAVATGLVYLALVFHRKIEILFAVLEMYLGILIIPVFLVTVFFAILLICTMFAPLAVAMGDEDY